MIWTAAIYSVLKYGSNTSTEVYPDAGVMTCRTRGRLEAKDA